MSAKLLHVLLSALLFSACTLAPKKVVEPPPPPAPPISGPPVGEREAPAKKNIIVLQHKHFTVFYDLKYRLAKYVKYTMTAETLKKKVARRRERFIPDPLLQALNIKPVEKKDYLRSGYDKGHLAPAGDFPWSQEAMDATFVMSNMAPQKPRLNREAWRHLEEKVRRLACGEERVTVITGPVLDGNLPKLASGVPIPHQFFKIVIDETPPRKAIAFLYHQSDKGNITDQRIVPIHVIETKISENFWPIATDEKRLPAQLAQWNEADCK